MTRRLETNARRPLSHASDGTGTCEGKPDCILASPSNPTKFAPQNNGGANSKKEHRVHTIRCRLNSAELAHVQELAAHLGISISELTRDALGLSQARKRKPVPKIDPALLRQLISAGTNLNQIARALNTQAKLRALRPLDAAILLAELVSIERVLLAIHEKNRHDD